MSELAIQIEELEDACEHSLDLLATILATFRVPANRKALAEFPAGERLLEEAARWQKQYDGLRSEDP